MTEYERLLEEAKTKVYGLLSSTAKDYVPRMYKAIRDELPHLSPIEARARIEKDCRYIWKKRTILKFLPEEAKDPKKQKSGRLGQKKHKFAAPAAAQQVEKEAIMIDANGRVTEPPKIPGSAQNLTTTNSAPQLRNTNQLESYGRGNLDSNLLQFEFWIDRKVIYECYLMLIRSIKDKALFRVKLDKQTFQVISAGVVQVQ